MKFYGIFKEIDELNIEGLVRSDLYEGYFSEFYENLSKGKNKEEIEIYLSNAYASGGNVLELACGNGRLTIELARRGVNIIGIDNSKDMLAILDRKIKKSPAKVKKNITFYEEDIFNLDIKEDFNMAMIPATSICLLLDNIDNILNTMNYIYDKLPEGGRFVFDYVYEFSELVKQPEMKIFTKSNEGIKDFVMMQEFRDFKENRAILNLYAERIENGNTERYLGCTSKTIVSETVIDELISRTKFKVIDKIDTDDNIGKIRYVILEK